MPIDKADQSWLIHSPSSSPPVINEGKCCSTLQLGRQFVERSGFLQSENRNTLDTTWDVGAERYLSYAGANGSSDNPTQKVKEAKRRPISRADCSPSNNMTRVCTRCTPSFLDSRKHDRASAQRWHRAKQGEEDVLALRLSSTSGGSHLWPLS